MRKWLENNKIWFETIAAVTLSIAAILVSCTSVVEFKKQNKLTELQMLPKFTISVIQEKSGRNGNLYDDESIYITNNGGYFRDFKIKTATVLTINEFNIATLKTISKDKLIYGYYFGNAYNPDNIIHPVSVKGYGNNLKLTNLSSEYRERLYGNDIYGDLSITRYVKIQYVDFFEKEQIEYYQVAPIYGSSLINKATGEKIFEQQDNIDRINFNELDFDLLQSIISE